MKINILIGGKAGQGINKISGIISKIMIKQGLYTFNYRDYPSIIRGGHNFNILTISDKKVSSNESVLDGIVAMDDKTILLHKKELKKEGFTISPEKFAKFGINLNVALAGALIKILGIEKKTLFKEVESSLKTKESLKAAETGFDSYKKKYTLPKSNKKIKILTGNAGTAQGAINSKLDIYFAYPMTPATNLMHELASREMEENLIVFQNENEIAIANCALGASFSGARVMVGTSGGGYDLMTEALSMQGISEIPLTVYLVSRQGPGTGVPTYTCQGDLDIALRGGHGEFPRVVIAPGNPKECIEKTNEALYLSQKYGLLSIILSDKYIAESEFSYSSKIDKPLPVKVKRKIPGERSLVKASSYEHDSKGFTTENAELTKLNNEKRIEKYKKIKKECDKFEMIKIYGNKKSKNLVIGWGSTKGAILDAIEGQDFKFLQVLYLKPLSNKIKKEMEKAKNIILVENNLTGQLGRLLREKTGIKIKHRILKYDARPFRSDILKKQLLKII